MAFDAGPTGARLGQHSLAVGVAAVLTTFVPGLGDLVTLPAAVIAVALGLIGVRRYETGRAITVVPAAVGAALGALAGLGVFVVALASGT